MIDQGRKVPEIPYLLRPQNMDTTNIVRVDPKERLPNLEDREHPIYGYRNLMVNLPRYRCPHCGEYTVFDLPGVEPSPLPPDILSQFDARTPHNSQEGQGVSDFLCRICSRPVRVVYRIEEIHMASYAYFAEFVLELRAV